MKKKIYFIAIAILLVVVGTTAQTTRWSGAKQISSKQRAKANAPLQEAGSSFTTLDYSTLIPVGTTSGSVTATDNSFIDPYGSNSTGKPYSFTTKTGKPYKVTCTFTTTGNFNDYMGVYLLKDGTWSGDPGDIAMDFYHDASNKTSVTVSGVYVASANSNVRLLIYDNSSNDYNYSITIEEEEYSVTPYTVLSYPTLATDGTSATGALVTTTLPGGFVTKGAGYSFTVQTGKIYQVTCRYFASQVVNINTALFLLTGGTLQGDNNDIITSNGGNAYDSEYTVTLNYTATANGTIRILLTDLVLNDLIYSLKVKEITSPPTAITLTELLNNNANSITYSSNMQVIKTGTLPYLVEGNGNPGFRIPGFNYYAAAHKITLAQSNNIQIHLNTTNDAVLYIYKPNGSGEYVFVALNDENQSSGGPDSYIDFTADADGDYYIVTTVYDYDIPAPDYTLTVWNSATQPVNAITAISPSANSVSINDNATDLEIRTALAALTLTGTTTVSPVTIDNLPNLWVIASGGLSATYTPSAAPFGYTLDSSLQPVTITINYTTTGINDIEAMLATVYAWGKNIVVKNAETGSRLLIADITGKIIVNTVVKDAETSIPVPASGLYIVRVGAHTTKVICR